MPIQKVAPPTLEEIQRKILRLAERFGISSEKFEESGGLVEGIPEDTAEEWLFLLEQRKVLLCLNPKQYWKSTSGPRVANEEDRENDRQSLAA